MILDSGRPCFCPSKTILYWLIDEFGNSAKLFSVQTFCLNIKVLKYGRPPNLSRCVDSTDLWTLLYNPKLGCKRIADKPSLDLWSPHVIWGQTDRVGQWPSDFQQMGCGSCSDNTKIYWIEFIFSGGCDKFVIFIRV